MCSCNHLSNIGGKRNQEASIN